MRVSTAIQPHPAFAGCIGGSVEFTGDGLVIGLRRHRRRADVPVRAQDPVPLRQFPAALAPSGLRRQPRIPRSRRVPAGLPRLRPGAHRAGAVGATSGPAHPRLRRRRGLADPAGGQDNRGHTAALLVGGGRQRRQTPGRRAPRRHPTGRPVPHRRRRDLLQARPQVPDHRGRPRHGQGRLGRSRTVTRHRSRSSSMPSAKSAPPRSRPSRSTPAVSTAGGAATRRPRPAVHRPVPRHQVVQRSPRQLLPGTTRPTAATYLPSGRHSNWPWRRTRSRCAPAPKDSTKSHRAFINRLRRHNYRLFRAWELKEATARPIPQHRSRRRGRLPQDAGAPARCAARSPAFEQPSPPHPQALRRRSSPPSNSDCQTPASKASTPRSESSNAEATDTQHPNRSSR